MFHRAFLSLTVGWLSTTAGEAILCGQDAQQVNSVSHAGPQRVLMQRGLLTQTDAGSRSESASGVITVKRASIKCMYKVQVSAQSDGLIENLLADEGSIVKKGDVLLTIDSRVAEAELRVAKKEAVAARKTAEQTANVDYAKAAAEVSREEFLAEMELYAKRATTESVMKRKRLEAQRAIYGVDVAEVEHENNGLAADVADEKVRAAEVRLELYEVVAPYDGIIVQRLRAQGEWTRAGEPILQLFSMDEMKVEAFVSVEEVQARGLQLSQLKNAPMKIIVPVSREYNSTEETFIDFVSPEIDAGFVRVSGKINNKRIGEGPWTYRDAMTAEVQIQLQ